MSTPTTCMPISTLAPANATRLRRIGAKRSRGLLVTSGVNVLDEHGQVSQYVQTLAHRHGISMMLAPEILALAQNFYDEAAAVRNA